MHVLWSCAGFLLATLVTNKIFISDSPRPCVVSKITKLPGNYLVSKALKSKPCKHMSRMVGQERGLVSLNILNNIFPNQFNLVLLCCMVSFLPPHIKVAIVK